MHNVAFHMIDRAYDEAMALLIDARNLAAESIGATKTSSQRHAELRQLTRSFRITTRLSQVVAWLMARRALRAGEITEHEAREERFRLSCLDACLAGDDESDMASARLRHLSARSLLLYRRIARLDSLIDHPSPSITFH